MTAKEIKEIKEIIGYYIVCPIISLVFAYATFNEAKELYVLYKGNEFKATITEVEIIKSTKSKNYKISFEYEGKKCTANTLKSRTVGEVVKVSKCDNINLFVVHDSIVVRIFDLLFGIIFTLLFSCSIWYNIARIIGKCRQLFIGLIKNKRKAKDYINNIKYEISSETTCLVTGYNGEIVEVSIPEEIIINRRKYKVTKLRNSCFENCKSLTNIIIPNSISELGDYCFYNCTSLTNISLPNGIKKLGDSCFQDCKSLVNVNLPNTIVKVGDFCFYNCISLINITIPNNMRELGKSCFDNCKSLTNITLPDGIRRLGDSCFYNCISLTNITLPNTIIIIDDSCFYNCISLTNITLPNTITIIGDSCFEHCELVTDITLPESIRELGDSCFKYCESLVNVNLPKGTVKYGDNCFEYCESLIVLNLPESFTQLEIIRIFGNDFHLKNETTFRK